MPTTVTAYYTNGASVSLKGFLTLDTPATSALRMTEVSGLLCHACKVLIDEPGYTAYGQEDAVNWAPLNPVVKMPDGQALHGDILIIDALPA